MGRRLRDLAILGSIFVIGLLADDWIASAAIVLLLVGLRYLLRQPGPPIVAAAFCNQWLQVTAGIMYFALTGRQVVEMRTPVYRPMVLIGMVCVAVVFAGFYFAARFRRTIHPRDIKWTWLPWTTNQIAAAYAAVVAVSGILTELAWSSSGLTQAILVFSRVRYVLLFLLLTRLARPVSRWAWILGIVGMEVLLGFTGFFADFREPLVIATIAVLGVMNRREGKTWLAIGALALIAVSSALVWTAIKPIIRKNYTGSTSTMERLSTVADATSSSFARRPDIWKIEADNMISRIWAVYYPAMALARVPSILPYENGAILKGAIGNVLTPRAFFPEKPILPSQSEEVRKYAGVWVGGRETNTSYAFGYAGEAYVDFGFPLMLLPIFAFGFILGIAYRFLSRHIRYDELRIGVSVVIVWSTLSAYEASWIMMIGPSITTVAILGGGAMFVDRVLYGTEKRRALTAKPAAIKSWAADITVR